MTKKKVTFYIDGFNFYYGLKTSKKSDITWKRYYWIDMIKLCNSFLSEDQELQKVIYFTASPLDIEKSSRQSAFLNANKLINGDKFEIVRGKYIEKDIYCPLCKGYFFRPEEKRTDVNISVRMLEDCFLDRTDTFALVSVDSDLIPPLETIIKFFSDKKIKIYFPPNRYSREMGSFLTKNKIKAVFMEKNKRRFEEAIMSDVVELNGKSYTIPEKWKVQED